MPKANDPDCESRRKEDKWVNAGWFRPLMLSLSSLILAAATGTGVFVYRTGEAAKPAVSTGSPETAGEVLTAIQVDVSGLRAKVDMINADLDVTQPGWRNLAEKRFVSIEKAQGKLMEALNATLEVQGETLGELRGIRGELRAMRRTAEEREQRDQRR